MSDDAKFFNALQARLIMLETRLNKLETATSAKLGWVHQTSFLVDNQTLNANATLTTTTVYNITGVPAKVRGVFIMLNGISTVSGAWLNVSAADTTPDGYSPRVVCPFASASYYAGGMLMVPVDTAGQFIIKANAAQWTGIYSWVVGWWL